MTAINYVILSAKVGALCRDTFKSSAAGPDESGVVTQIKLRERIVDAPRAHLCAPQNIIRVLTFNNNDNNGLFIQRSL